eukprot:jgi/Pico_ML_1/52121/g2881.t1
MEDVRLMPATGTEAIQARELWDERQGGRIVFAFATHFADLTTWEYARRLRKEMAKLQQADVKLVFVGIGRVEQAKLFCQACGFEQGDVYCDPNGENYRLLGFKRGFAPEANVSGYLKLLAMLAGLGSPVRLQNMVSVLSRWKELCPDDDRLLTQLGGTLAFKGDELVYRFDDQGILVYADVDELIQKVTT